MSIIKSEIVANSVAGERGVDGVNEALSDSL